MSMLAGGDALWFGRWRCSPWFLAAYLPMLASAFRMAMAAPRNIAPRMHQVPTSRIMSTKENTSLLWQDRRNYAPPANSLVARRGVEQW